MTDRSKRPQQRHLCDTTHIENLYEYIDEIEEDNEFLRLELAPFPRITRKDGTLLRPYVRPEKSWKD